MRFKKGQTATEYLIILAVVIVIALIVVGVLGGIPSIGGGAKSNTLSSYWRTSEIGVVSMSVGAGDAPEGGGTYSDASGTLNLRNNMPGTITINNVTLTDVSSRNIDFNDNQTVLAAGQSGTFEFDNLSNSGQEGETFTYLMSVTYSDSSTNAQYIFDGDGNNLEGTIRSN